MKVAALGLLLMAVAGCAGQVPSALPTAAILQASPEPATQTPAPEPAGAEGGGEALGAEFGTEIQLAFSNLP